MVAGKALTGRLIGVGVGPGDPELMTLKAARVIGAADVVAYPVANGEASRARAIAGAAIRPGTVEIGFDLPMRIARDPAQAAYDAAAAAIVAQLDKGADVAVLCEGDPLFYGSFMYLAARLAERTEIEVVPGITSIGAAAAALRRPVVARAQSVAVCPAGGDVEVLRATILAHDTVVLLKVGRHLAQIRALLTELGCLDQAAYVGNASHPDEVTCPLADAPAEAPYFSLILISKGRDPWLNPPHV